MRLSSLHDLKTASHTDENVAQTGRPVITKWIIKMLVKASFPPIQMLSHVVLAGSHVSSPDNWSHSVIPSLAVPKTILPKDPWRKDSKNTEMYEVTVSHSAVITPGPSFHVNKTWYIVKGTRAPMVEVLRDSHSVVPNLCIFKQNSISGTKKKCRGN